MKTDIQKRLLKTDIEARENKETNEKIIVGVLPYNSPSEKMALGYTDATREIITPTAWNKTLADKRNIFLNYNHNSDLILASTKSGTMTVENQEDGLHFRAILPDTDIGNRAYTTIKRGDVKTLSFEFYPVDYETRDGISYIKSGRLEAVSCCVSTPAYTATNAEARTINDQIQNIKRTIKEKELNEMDNETINELKDLLKALLDKFPSNKKDEESKNEPVKKPEEMERVETSEQPKKDIPTDDEKPKPQDEKKQDEKVDDSDENEEIKKLLDELISLKKELDEMKS